MSRNHLVSLRGPSETGEGLSSNTQGGGSTLCRWKFLQDSSWNMNCTSMSESSTAPQRRRRLEVTSETRSTLQRLCCASAVGCASRGGLGKESIAVWCGEAAAQVAGRAVFGVATLPYRLTQRNVHTHKTLHRTHLGIISLHITIPIPI